MKPLTKLQQLKYISLWALSMTGIIAVIYYSCIYIATNMVMR